ncbi:HD domain-containing phosphohydrolase [Trichlorobacter ammonificans]|uniref:Two-component system response regulator n=1 Tax=Trichlorobacter ammonificans TaxID=2916410 RepID=A0ABM9DA03_9BACT|nr:HD domain-containing phosphohydrolase [Trichlorobacter ammonificans]CAH2032047.1 conserved protein of unknown function [Trichlorobacter ammonificans]
MAEEMGTVLIVDDTPANLQLLESILVGEGYAVRAAINGRMALTAVQARIPDLILLDITMPEMNGYELCSILKSDPRLAEIPVIFVTALNDVVDEERGFAAGGVDFVTKPVCPPVVLARVRTHIALHRAQQELQEWNSNLKVRVKGLSSLVTRNVQKLGAMDMNHRYHREEWLEILTRLLDMMDPELLGHASRVAALAAAVAGRLQCTRQETETIRIAGLLHDIGKVGLPAGVTSVPEEKLPDNLKRIYLTHAVRGQLLISHIDWLKEAGVLIRHHHEQMNGSGVPDRLIGAEIPLGARIIAIADYMDRLVSHATAGTTLFTVMKSVRNLAGRSFDPNLVACFEEVAPGVLARPATDKGQKEIAPVKGLQSGVVAAEDLYSGTRIRLLERGEAVTSATLSRISLALEIDPPECTTLVVTRPASGQTGEQG